MISVINMKLNCAVIKTNFMHSRTEDQHFRLIYESVVHYRTCDNTWRNIKKFLKNSGLGINVDTISYYAYFRKFCPKCKVSPSEYVDIQKKWRAIQRRIPKTVDGQTLLALFKSWAITPAQSTVSKWFIDINLRYNKSTTYNKSQLEMICYKAIILLFTRAKKGEADAIESLNFMDAWIVDTEKAVA